MTSPPQLFSLVIFLLCLAIMNMFYPGNRGAMHTAAIVLYALTAGTAGFVSAYFYCRLLGGESGRWARNSAQFCAFRRNSAQFSDGAPPSHIRWAMNLVLSATLFPAPFFVTFAFLNPVAIAYTSQAAPRHDRRIIVIGPRHAAAHDHRRHHRAEHGEGEGL